MQDERKKSAGVLRSHFNSSPNDKVLDLPKLKAFADDKLNVSLNVKVVLYRIENIVGKEKKFWLPAFSSFLPQCFQKAFQKAF